MAKAKAETPELVFDSDKALLQAVLDNEAALEAAKEAYKTRDLLITAWTKRFGDDGKDRQLDGRTITLVDCFADKNCQFKATSFRRFDLKVEEAD